MVVELVKFEPHFEKTISKIKNHIFLKKVRKQIRKVIENPEIGKPMQYTRKGTRELYISPFRLSYAYFPEENKVTFLDLYHKDEQ